MITGLIISCLGGALITYLIMQSYYEGHQTVKHLKHEQEEFCDCYRKITLTECPKDVLLGFQSYEHFVQKLDEIKRSVKQYNL
jgi:hypothetical protein